MTARLVMWRVLPPALLAVLVSLAVAVHGAHAPDRSLPPPTALADSGSAGGTLVIAGGGWVTTETRQRFVELAGGSAARIVVIPAVDPRPGTEEQWLAPWRSLGVATVAFLNARNRTVANSPAFCAPLKKATGVWFSGGFQSLLAERYVGTAVEQCLHDLLWRNGVIGGCSAGAAILSRVMIEEGESNPIEARGLGLMTRGVIDQHFLRRNRLWRMEQTLSAHPDLVGLGVDERTALVVDIHSGRLSVLGDSYALVCLPSTTGPVRIEVLKAGDRVSHSQLRAAHLAYRPPPERSDASPGDSESPSP